MVHFHCRLDPPYSVVVAIADFLAEMRRGFGVLLQAASPKRFSSAQTHQQKNPETRVLHTTTLSRIAMHLQVAYSGNELLSVFIMQQICDGNYSLQLTICWMMKTETNITL